MQLTLTISADLAARLRRVTADIPKVLEMGLRECEAQQQDGFSGMNDVLETLAALPRPEEVLALRPSPSLQSRISELLEKNRANGLSPAEESEWQRFEYIEHLVRLAKAKAALRLQENKA